MKKPGLVLFSFIIAAALLSPMGMEVEGSSSVRVISIVRNAAELCDEAYNPSVVTVPVGTTVVWVNQDIVAHTIVSGKKEGPCRYRPLPPGLRTLDGGTIFQTAFYWKTFKVPGTYPYICHLPMHRMHGTIIVVP